MNLTVIRLQPHGAFHFGQHGIGIEASADACPSDSLYAALLWEQIQAGEITWAQSDPEVAPNPPFRLSSCLPYVGAVPLLPLPLLPPLDAEHHPGERKRFKKIRFVSPAIFKALLAGRSLRDFLPSAQASPAHPQLQGGTVLLAAEDEAESQLDTIRAHSEDQSDLRLWTNERVPHVTVGRVNNASAYYETGQVRFSPGCGLALLVQGDVDALWPFLERLGESGLGGRRSKGLGQFKPIIGGTLELPDPDSERLVLLSRYLPSRAELEADVLGPLASYQLVDVGGWLYTLAASTQRRRPVRLIREGSVVQRAAGAAPVGAVCDVAPDYEPFPHKVWRYGLALAVGVPGEAVWQTSQ